MSDIDEKRILTRALLNYLACLQITPEQDEQLSLRKLVDVDTDKTQTGNTLNLMQLREKLQQIVSAAAG